MASGFDAAAVMSRLIENNMTPVKGPVQVNSIPNTNAAADQEVPPPYVAQPLNPLNRELEEARRSLKQAQDEVQFQKLKVKEKEKRVKDLEEERKETARIRLRLAAVETQLEIKTKKLQQAEQSVVVKMIPSNPQVVYQTVTVNNNEGAAERFVEAQADKLKAMRLKKHVRRLRVEHMKKMESMERAFMETHDDLVPIHKQRAPQGTLTAQRERAFSLPGGGSSGFGSGSDADTPTGGLQRKGSLISFEALKRSKHVAAYHLPLKEPLKLTTPSEDSLMNKRLERSSFNEYLTSVRSEILNWAGTWRESHETSLGNMWYIFTERDKPGGCILARPKDDFHKEVKLNIAKTRSGLMDLVKLITTALQNILSGEKAVKQKWLLENASRDRVDATVEANIPPPEDPRIALLQHEINQLNDRLRTFQKDFTQKNAVLEASREKAQANLTFVQSKMFELHRELYSSLHAIHKHRYKWIARLPDPLRRHCPDASQQQLTVQFNSHLGEVVSQDVSYLKQLAEYFVSDELFGSDMSEPNRQEVFDAEETPVMKRRESLGAKAMAMSQHQSTYSKLQKKMMEKEIAEHRALAEANPEPSKEQSSRNFTDPSSIDVLLEVADRPSTPPPPPPVFTNGSSNSFGARPTSAGNVGANNLLRRRGSAPQPVITTQTQATMSNNNNNNVKPQPPRRMIEWQSKQNALWEEKRRQSLMGSHIPTMSSATSHRVVVVPKVQFGL